ncbi:MAG: radical SAM/SPASM domain-containing protein [Planctomycetota bacterium]|jgi:molybdenum cofactor biosynthesis enzyme MoaA
MIYINNNHIDILIRKVPCPERLNVELTTYCNLKCIMCRGSQVYTKEDNAYRHLRLDEFARILNGIDLSKLKILNLAGAAEPLLNPDILPILAHCREKKIIVEFITNGMLLTSQISRQILGCSSEIHVSFGGSKKQTFESIRQGADFELVCENIRTLSKLKESNNNQYPHIWLNPILMKKNIHELPEIIELARELGCQGVTCSHLTVNSPELIDESLFFHKEECNSFLQKAEILANINNVLLIRPEYFSSDYNCKDNNNENIEAWKKCRFLWNHAILGIEGIQPCSSNIEIDFDGDIVRNKFVDIWNNDWYADKRYRLLTGTPPVCCKTCKDPSVKDVNNIGSYFTEDNLPDAISYAHTLSTMPLTKEYEPI